MPSQPLLLPGLNLQLKRSRKRKTLTIEITHSEVIVRAPQHLALNTIETFVLEKENWIRHHLQNMPEPPAKLKLQQGCLISYLNENIQLNLYPRQNTRQQALLENNILHLPVGNTHEQTAIKQALIKWYKQRALQHCQQAIEHYAPLMGLSLPKSKVREYKRRWGSCSSKGELSFNWRLVMAPKRVLNYVVVHELAHLIEFNHSKRFWNTVERIIPDWRQDKQWLNETGADLYRI